MGTVRRFWVPSNGEKKAYHESPGQVVTALCASESCKQDDSGSAAFPSTACGVMAREWPSMQMARKVMMRFMVIMWRGVINTWGGAARF